MVCILYKFDKDWTVYNLFISASIWLFMKLGREAVPIDSMFTCEKDWIRFVKQHASLLEAASHGWSHNTHHIFQKKLIKTAQNCRYALYSVITLQHYNKCNQNSYLNNNIDYPQKFWPWTQCSNCARQISQHTYCLVFQLEQRKIMASNTLNLV